MTEIPPSDLDAMKQAEEEARALAQMKSSFLATMSHEIRTPMQSVYGLLELIVDEEISDSAREMVLTARKSASGLLEILDDILDLAKVEAGKVELDHFEIPIRTLVYGVLECMEVRLMGKPVELAPDVATDIPFVIMGDPTRLRQILINLVGNAVKFTEKGKVTLRVTQDVRSIPPSDTQGHADARLALRFEIIDTGMGMPPETAAKLFQPFTQADNSTQRKFGGTGLGLSISHRLVELMHGEIGVDSTVGQGSTFWFEIPTQAANEQTAQPLPDLDGIAVLSVEDHPKGAKEIKSSLMSMGAKVESVPTYAEGLALVKKRRFDVLVADQGLPDGLGIDLLKEATKLRPYMGLMIYTVRDDYGLQYTARVIGAKYLSKPASRLGLGEAVKNAANRIQHHVSKGPRRLLIAEDTESVQDVLRRQLNKLGVDADFVKTGVEALNVLEKGEHGILFTDLHMPDMDGYQLVGHIRAEEDRNNVDQMKRFPIIALTADVQMAQRQAYLSHGFDECLLKPVSLGQFRRLLIRWGVMQESCEEDDDPIEDTPPTTEQFVSDNNSDKPAVDLKAVEKQMGAIDAGVVEMLKAFIGMTQPLVDKISDPALQQDPHAIMEAAHSLKGAARSAGCMQLGDIAAEIQELGAKGQAVPTHKIQSLNDNFARVIAEIEAL